MTQRCIPTGIVSRTRAPPHRSLPTVGQSRSHKHRSFVPTIGCMYANIPPSSTSQCCFPSTTSAPHTQPKTVHPSTPSHASTPLPMGTPSGCMLTARLRPVQGPSTCPLCHQVAMENRVCDPLHSQRPYGPVLLPCCERYQNTLSMGFKCPKCCMPQNGERWNGDISGAR